MPQRRLWIRIGDPWEILSQPWEFTHLDDGYLDVLAHRNKGRKDSRIPLHPMLVERLRKIQDYGDLIFDWQSSVDILRNRWHKLQREAGVVRICREDHDHTPACEVYGFHHLKKSCGSLNTHLPQAVVHALMRHSSQATTRKYYQNHNEIIRGVQTDLRVPNVKPN